MYDYMSCRMQGDLAMIDYDYHHDVLRLGSPLWWRCCIFSGIGKHMTHVGWTLAC